MQWTYSATFANHPSEMESRATWSCNGMLAEPRMQAQPLQPGTKGIGM
jgi:hypothetical protein